MPLHDFESFVYRFGHQYASVDTEPLTRVPVYETYFAILADGKSGVVAVAECLRRCDSRQHGGIRRFGILGHGIPDPVLLELELALVAEMLPLAAAAFQVVGALRFDTCAVRVGDADYGGRRGYQR